MGDALTRPPLVERVLLALSGRRPIFHSEADFQHEFAWEVRTFAPEISLRLEQPFPGRTSGAIDILLGNGHGNHAIELKYLTRSYDGVFGGEEFKLKNHGAQDVRRYDVCKDVSRIEEFCRLPRSSGSVIVLTNDPYYWQGRPSEGTCAHAFDISEGRQLTGSLNWAQHTGAGTKRNREAILRVSGSYRLAWQDYSDVGGRGGRFRYLYIPVKGAL